MRSRIARLVVRWWVLPLVLTVGASTVAAQDLRLVGAAAAQDALEVRALLDEGVDVDARRADGATAILWAAHWDDLKTVGLLLRAGASVNAADDHGVTPLHRAAENASPAMTDALLAAGADANASQTSGLTPLMTAARTGNAQVVRRLIGGGARVNNATSETGSTALMWAVAEGHADIVRVLLDAGADARASTVKGFTPLLFAARNGDIPMARTLLAAGVDVDHTGADGTHALPYAIILGHDAFALFLLEEGADPNASMGGVRALHATVGRVDTWLGDWNRRHGGSDRYRTIGRRAIEPTRALPLVEALLARGADPNAGTTKSGMFMSYIGYPRKGAFEPFACGTGDLLGATPLWVAAYWANSRVRDIRAGRGDAGGSVQAAAADASGGILRALLAAGADLHRTTADGTTPLMVAAGLGRSTYTPREPRGGRSLGAEQAVRILLDAGADINAVNEADFTALHGAAFRGLNEVITYLVEQGADIDARDFRGRTAYRMAEGAKQSFQFQSWPETAALLAELGANTRLGIPGTVQERLRDVPAAANDN
ncbi:MAG: ankyrin repeat domain-containing protein [Acidobacteria bacterium]|nr:ankyrin repeat domain-containing protein [Acidobacteriota bacterium]